MHKVTPYLIARKTKRTMLDVIVRQHSHDVYTVKGKNVGWIDAPSGSRLDWMGQFYSVGNSLMLHYADARSEADILERMTHDYYDEYDLNDMPLPVTGAPEYEI